MGAEELQDRHAVHFRHDQIQDHQSDLLAPGAKDEVDRFLTALRSIDLVPETADELLQDPLLRRIVVNDENRLRHCSLLPANPTRRRCCNVYYT